jgi:hypothetical protein
MRGRRATVPVRRAAAAAVLAVVVAGPAARAEEPAPAPAVPAPAAEEPSKLECVSHHEAAQVARRDARLLEARAALQLCSRASCPAAIRADCVDWLAEVQRSLPSVVVTARARGADVVDVRVFADGKLVVDKLTGAAIDVDPGEHRFRFESPPWPAVERKVLVSEGVKGRPIDVELAPPLPAPKPAAATAIAAPPSPTLPRHLERFDYILGGVAAGGLATFAVVGGIGLYDRHQLQQQCQPFCSDDQVAAVRTKFLVADVALGAAVVSLAVLYLRATHPPDSRAAVALSLTGLGIQGVF